MRWKFGVSMGPPNVLLAPKPTSSVKIRSTFGAPAGASTPFGKSGTESFAVRPIFPLNGCSGCGKTSWPKAVVARSRNNVEKHVNAATCGIGLASTNERSPLHQRTDDRSGLGPGDDK